MQELIKIEKQEIGTQNVNSVNAREIHNYLGVKTVFAHWIKRAIVKYDFLENVDFIAFITDVKSGKRDFIVTLDMAKELAMLENNEKGKETRKYFISCENQITTQVHDLTPALLEMTKSITTISKNMNTLLSSTVNTSNEVNRMKADIREIKEQISQPTVTPKNTETLDIEKALQIVSKLNKTVTEVVVDNELMSLWNVSFDEYSLIYIIAVSKRWSEKKIINDKEYIHMYHAKFQELMPKPRHERQVRRSIAKLVDKGLIEKVVLLNKGYYKLTAVRRTAKLSR